MGIGPAPLQYEVLTYDRFIKEYYRNIGKDVFISVHALDTRHHYLFNKIFFDMDNDNLKIAYRDTKIFVDYLDSKDILSRVVFSARKGFHIYIDFALSEIKDYAKRMDKFMEILSMDLGITSFDRGVNRDRNRILRVPFTTNTKSNKMCIPVDIHTFDFDNPQAVFIPRQESPKFIKMFQAFPIDMDEDIDFESAKTSSDNSQAIQNTFHFIMNNAGNITDGRMNLVWKILIPSMVHLQYSDGDVLRGVKDFCMSSYGNYTGKQKQFAEYYLKRTRQTGFLPMRLDRFRTEFGLGGI